MLMAAVAASGLTACAAVPEPTPASTVRAVDMPPVQTEPVEVSVDGGAARVEVTFREITIEPGAGTGEHCHDGQLIAVVQEELLTHYAATHPGGVRVYSAGSRSSRARAIRMKGATKATWMSCCG